MTGLESPADSSVDAGLEAAMRALSSISATLSVSYTALEARTQRIERELERKVSELDAVRKHLAAVLEALPTGVIVRAADGKVVRVNAAALSILGATADELLGSRDHALLDDSTARPRADGWRERVLEVSGQERRVLASRRSPVAGEGSVEILDDRTALVALTERLHGLDKLAALGNMAGGIAHELRNPMHAAAGFAALLTPRLPEGSKERHFAQCIARSLASAEGVLASMLTLATPDGLIPELIEPTTLLDEAIELALAQHVYEGTQSAWNITRSSELAPFRGDRIKLRQALRNLVANAIEVQRGGGRIHVSAELHESEVALAVGDAGPGVAAALRGRVLEPFFTTRAEGTGLGLPLVATIANLHGGRLELSSRPAPLGGAHFTLLFPFRT